MVAALVVATDAGASSAYESTYGYDRTWNTAVRLVRVDLGLKVTEKDQDTGYLMFEYRSPESHGASPGSIEMVHSKDPAAPVRVLVQLPQMPRYHEQMIVDALAKKMRQEYGDPPTLTPTPKQEPGDAGLD
jgi:hypothetical protein